MGKNEIIIFCLIIQILKIVQRQLFLTINNIQQEILITFLHLYYLSNNDHELLENLKKISLSLEDISMDNYEIQTEVAIKKKKLSELFNFKLAKFHYEKEPPREYLESFFIDLNQHKKIPQHILKDSLSLKQSFGLSCH